ncbi:SRPBCC domain-containing protein [Arthrobacter sp. RT-1]|uniref:SRPBCC domain-containing protein n=1 Tax=Arthrobacter sp. RT-1 TaxID=2292263 RepID=UPI000E1F2BBC|nr:SRPBCC domain-containing protein [Arthrobacter sp. RT-1]RDV12292.1 SRPBCC domain-containing protein [Arthrobacter sp. RT-1]
MSVTTHIQSPPDVVWQIFTGFGAYPDWNPFITQASGDIKVGQRLILRIVPPGAGGMTFRPQVTALEPEHLLEWSGTLGIPGLFDGRHTFILEPTAGGTTLTQTETFTGLLVPLSTGMLLRTKKGFQNMNDALQNRAASFPAKTVRPTATE